MICVPGHNVPGDEVPGDEVPGDEVPGDDVMLHYQPPAFRDALYARQAPGLAPASGSHRLERERMTGDGQLGERGADPTLLRAHAGVR
ncbi:hypothetical protein ACFQH9_05550 [Pseudonocardia lutea]|uniref:Uncharacterized protein n=1 Tax=Pseudonocardia lutea TaxID=2172015 RepID=A0ABW1I3H1_9PSEU